MSGCGDLSVAPCELQLEGARVKRQALHSLEVEDCGGFLCGQGFHQLR